MAVQPKTGPWRSGRTGLNTRAHTASRLYDDSTATDRALEIQKNWSQHKVLEYRACRAPTQATVILALNRYLVFEHLDCWATHMGVAKHQGHLIWTRNNTILKSGPQNRTLNFWKLSTLQRSQAAGRGAAQFVEGTAKLVDMVTTFVTMATIQDDRSVPSRPAGLADRKQMN